LNCGGGEDVVYQIGGRLYNFERMKPRHSRFGFPEERTARTALLAVSVKAPLRSRIEDAVKGIGQQGIELSASQPRLTFRRLELAVVFHVRPPVY
jgi:hypothetical protein